MRDITVPALTHELGADADASFDPDDGPWEISGIAVAPGDVLHMDDGTPVLMTEEELETAAPTQADEPLSVDHPTDDDGDYVYPPPSDATAGTVAAAGYLDGRGVGYSGSIHDPEIARGMHGGSYEVSIHPEFELGARDPDTGAYVAENIQFRDLSIVSKGDSPSNTANWGASAELAAWANRTDIADELAASADGAGSDDLQGPISSAVNGTLRALGFDPGDVDTDATALAADAESGGEGDDHDDHDDHDDTNTMTDREQQINALVEHSPFDTDDLEDWDDEQIETTHSNFVDAGDDPDDDTEQNNADDGAANVVEVDIGDHDSMDDYIEARAEAAVASASEQSEREDLVATITDATDKTESDLAEWPLDALEDKASSLTGAAHLPGSTGRHTETVAASHSTGDDAVSKYGTGVEGRQ
jgi:hypothetical protein